tara:strand:+ start:293 stop:478 length:186 start_codon:yes stop_codon:yes gene_type:complete
LDIERKAGRVDEWLYPTKLLDSRIELKTIDVDLNNKYEYFEFYGIKYNRNEFKKEMNFIKD